MILLACSARYSDLDRGQFAHTVESFYTASQAPAEGMQDLIPEEWGAEPGWNCLSYADITEIWNPNLRDPEERKRIDYYNTQ